jgi:tetratricopeptide (TPR) repeat protein
VQELLEFSQRDLKRVFSLSPLLLRALVEEGHIHPVAIDGASSYSFQDLLILRTASTLRQARVPAHKIRAALRHLRQVAKDTDLPALTQGPGGRGIAVSAGARLWSYESGQYALPLESGSFAGTMDQVRLSPGARPTPYAAAVHFERALTLEHEDSDTARVAYAACLAQDPLHLEARINLGRLLHRAGELTQATDVYRDASEPSALLLLHFAALLEEQNRFGEALEKYRRAVTMDPQLAEGYCTPARLRAPKLPNFSN